MIEGFRPMLFPNDLINIEDIHGKYLMSTKLDGIRCLFLDGKMVSRKFKNTPNVVLRKRFKHMRELSLKTGLIYDGELWGPYNYPEIAGYVMSHDKWCPEDIQYHCFDVLDPSNRDQEAYKRALFYSEHLLDRPYVIPVMQDMIFDPGQIAQRYESYLQQGFEGAILKHVFSTYKFGRLTFKSGQGYKLKPYRTFEAKIKGVEQRFQAKPDSQRTIDAFGKSKTSHKQDDREPVDMAASFIIEYNGLESHVQLAMTDEEKTDIWLHQDKYIGRMIEFKGMLIGSKDRVRHPVFLRYRDDL